MREIKFRYIWERPKSGAGSYCPDDPKVKITYNSLVGMEKGEFKKPPPYSWEKHHQMGCFSILIARNEYTGLKDKNGKEIYEGDLYNQKGCMYPVEVYYDERYADFRGRVNGEMQPDKTYHLMFHSCFEVISNIYENKELLEDKE